MSDLKRVKFIYKNSFHDKGKLWERMFPNNDRRFNNCEFIFDPNENSYDWLVVYNNFPNNNNFLAFCPKQNTIFITSEPSSITYYGKKFINQFGYILTGQEEYALSHHRKIYQQPALRWFYEANIENPSNINQLEKNIPFNKNQLISTICSNKKGFFTEHNKRLKFINFLKKEIPELNHLGRGFKPIKDKSEGLKNFKYHIVIENHIANHWWTEKLSDAFLGCTLPFYYGAPNINDYFSNQSIIKIDIDNAKKAKKTIIDSIKNNEFEKRIEFILEARKKVIHDYSIFSVLSKYINKFHLKDYPTINPFTLYSRHNLRKNCIVGIENLTKKIELKLINTFK